jgi:hypothetical protein
MRNPPISTRLQRTRRRFKHWRRTRKRGSPIPAALWASPVELAKDYGLNKTTQALRLDYNALKKRLESASHHSSPGENAGSAFFELVPPGPALFPECLIELENPQGAKMRIHVKGANLPDLAALSSAFWNAEV